MQQAHMRKKLMKLENFEEIQDESDVTNLLKEFRSISHKVDSSLNIDDSIDEIWGSFMHIFKDNNLP